MRLCFFDGNIARLILAEHGRVAVEATLRLPESSNPVSVRARWKEEAPRLWRRITEELYGDGNVPEEMPEEVHWEQTDSLTGILTLPPVQPGNLDLKLSLDDEGDARRCAANWPLCREALEREILAVLT